MKEFQGWDLFFMSMKSKKASSFSRVERRWQHKKDNNDNKDNNDKTVEVRKKAHAFLRKK